ncbi:MAG: tRNA uridine-5-carboxymethylaminomethyl(34) synthesis GTPase MnmE [Bacteroides sp.]|nr:tRNA uridine-5-carboxymethylaminomethyl(34) synthesis GTPase MnmE [Prevotella sp.]MCM1407686.1 tRNA uridine-5-carboxymethylaminomethyl(34) synthesis GTPase MnmE [Treponema brennaborense]MCM1469164.1 tRNA uridine-5-carboxymethylaminomethyl(34) synthesis GTPase MnmE [Bacteroides sp.]
MVTTENYAPEEMIAAIATALAPSALAVLRTSGKGVIEAVSKLFSRPQALLRAQGNTLVYGWIREPAADKKKIDEVMLAVYRAPASFTGEDMVEISCHGGTVCVLAVYALLLKNGFRAAERGEFTFRSFINGKTDLTKAEAVREIIEAKTDSGRSRAAGRLAGSLHEQFAAVKKMLIDTAAAIEAEIEYPEDENAVADAFDMTDLRAAEKLLADLSASWASEKLYQDGARIILCGRTNAGKSSLFNTLLKEERAIVSDAAGTTRDWLESWISVDGIPARLFDTAGLRVTDDIVEQRGVEMTRGLSRDADIILYVLDSSAGLTSEDMQYIRALPERTPRIIVWNKTDICAERAGAVCGEHTETLCAETAQVHISAKTGAGIAMLVSQIHSMLCGNSGSEREQAGIGSERQKRAADEALDSVRHALFAAESGYPLDAVVQDLEDALDAFGRITGETSPDDILESIFSRFCVGK